MELLEASVAVTVKSRVVRQPVVESMCAAEIIGVPQLSAALEAAATVASVGKVEGLHPKPKPIVGTVSDGLVVSLTVTVKLALCVLSAASVAV